MPTDEKPDAILVQHRGTVTFQGTAEDMARWGTASGDGGRNMMSDTHLPVDDLIFHVQIQTLHLNEAISRANDAGIKVGIEIETERHQVRAMPAAFVVHNRVRTIFGHEEPSPSWWSRAFGKIRAALN